MTIIIIIIVLNNEFLIVHASWFVINICIQNVSKWMQPIDMIMIYYWDKKLHISWCEFMLDLDSILGTAEDPSLIFFATMHAKDQVLGNVFGETFSDSFRHNLSPNPHHQDILLSTSCQIWDFLPSSWGCLLTLWLEICVPNYKFASTVLNDFVSK